jgi:hypothetical protein
MINEFKELLRLFYCREWFIEFDGVEQERYWVQEVEQDVKEISNDELEKVMDIYYQEYINPKSFMSEIEKDQFITMYDEFQLNK